MTSLRFCASPFLDFRARWALDTTTAWPELMFSLSSPQEERAGEKRPLLLNAPLPVPTTIELRSADFSPPRSGPAKTAGSGLKSALLSCRNSLNSMAVLPVPLPALLKQYWQIKRGERVRVRGHAQFYTTLG